MGKRCQVCDGPIVNGRCKYCGMPYRNDMELYHLNEDRSEHYRHASAKVKKAMAENEIPLSDRNKTVPKAAKTSSARTQTIRTQNTKVQTSRIQTSGTKKTSGQSYSAQMPVHTARKKRQQKSEKKKERQGRQNFLDHCADSDGNNRSDGRELGYDWIQDRRIYL